MFVNCWKLALSPWTWSLNICSFTGNHHSNWLFNNLTHFLVYCGHRVLQILYPPLHWIHAELAEQPAGLGGRHREGNLKPDLPGDGVPPPPPRVPPAFQRRQRQARRVRHALRDRRQVHLRRPTVSFNDFCTIYHVSPSPWVMDLFSTRGFCWERNGRGGVNGEEVLDSAELRQFACQWR